MAKKKAKKKTKKEKIVEQPVEEKEEFDFGEEEPAELDTLDTSQEYGGEEWE